MGFRKLSIVLQIYIAANILAAIPAAVLAWLLPRHDNLSVIALLVLFSMLLGTWRVELTILQAKMTLAFAAICLALMIQGEWAAVLCAIIGPVFGTYLGPQENSWKPRRVKVPLHRALFNLSNGILSTKFAADGYFLAIRHAPNNGMAMVLGLTVFTSTYFMLNTVGVSVAVSMHHKQAFGKVWVENFLWTAPGYFASASAAVGVYLICQHSGIWAILFMPVVYIIYYSYRLYMERLHKDMQHIHELNKLNRAIISSLAMAIDAKDRYTSLHINRVQVYAVALANAAGLTGLEKEAVATGALVHDIGKLGIPDRILGKPGKLTPEEFKRIQSHVEIGTEILSPIPFHFPVVDIVRTHHERWDGLGYPAGLRGDEIPVGGRIIAIVDVFDALTSRRPYRRAMTTEEALAILKAEAGQQFDPTLVALFEKVLPSAARELEELDAARPTAADGAGHSLEGSTALEQIGQAAAEMAAVCDVAHILAIQDTLEGVFDVTVKRALSLLPADTAIFYLREGDGSTLQAVAVSGQYEQRLAGMSMQTGEGASGWVASEQQPQVNASASLDIARRFGPNDTMELSAVTAVPIIHGPTALGVLSVYTTEYSVLSEHHLHVLNILAEHAAGAVYNLQRMEHQRELASTDPLTGLANSRSLVRHLEQMALQPDDPFSVLMLDLDGFKAVNDQLGHLRGDELLRLVARELSSIVRPGDHAYRYAGDEFVIVLPGATHWPAEQIADRVRTRIDAISLVEGQIRIGASVGVASFPQDGADGRLVLNEADRRMYQNKFERRGARLLAAGSLENLDPRVTIQPIAPRT